MPVIKLERRGVVHARNMLHSQTVGEVITASLTQCIGPDYEITYDETPTARVVAPDTLVNCLSCLTFLWERLPNTGL